MKLETYKSYVVAANEMAFNDRCFIDEVDTLKDARKLSYEYRAKTVKACVSCFLDNNTNGEAIFGYGNTVSEAKKDLKRILNSSYNNCYTI